MVPTKLYLKNGRIKVELAVGKGKKFHDKRESAASARWTPKLAPACAAGRKSRWTAGLAGCLGLQ